MYFDNSPVQLVTLKEMGLVLRLRENFLTRSETVKVSLLLDLRHFVGTCVRGTMRIVWILSALRRYHQMQAECRQR